MTIQGAGGDGAVRLRMVRPTEVSPGRLLTCPTCGATGGIALIAVGRQAEAACLQDHIWQDRDLCASAVRQLLHLTWYPPDDGCILYPYPSDAVCEQLLPDLVEDRSLTPGGPAARDDISWEAHASTATTSSSSAMMFCLMYARCMGALAVPADGSLYARLYPKVGGDAVCAHMACLLVALALYDTGRRSRLVKLSRLPLRAVRAALQPARADELRSLRPISRRPEVWLLRATDADRLQHADAETWERWRQAAADIVDDVLEDYARPGRENPQLFHLDARPRRFPDEATWYTDAERKWQGTW
ncbi:hypothetical protein ACIBK8_25560 [Streptomyces sp. NPDC050161]|uniref:hypothetical protein n=1 Tax=Streptomyces sp. NPDC050161 TaxID=3365604 RepID=UPI00378D5B11